MIDQATSPTHKERILVIAHAHPDFSLGGGEIAAYNLFKAYRNNEGVDDAWFLGRIDRGRGVTGIIGMRRHNEYTWEQGIDDWHLMKAAHQQSLTTWFVDLLRGLRPTIIHVHHYIHLGLEFLRVIKQVDPSIRIFITLHEYIAICRNNGQMIKTNGRLCSRESFDECHQCFPMHSSEDFWRRKHYFNDHFRLAEGFVSPSEFLRQRYIQWGVDPERIVVIENGQPDEAPLPPRKLREGETRNRFGFFGQITPYKGLDVLLTALTQMKKSDRKKVVLEVHGANLEHQSEDYQTRVNELRAPLIKEGAVQWVGPYQPHELRKRMAGVDWVVVPSVWWENSPMVIQEAFVCGRPLLVSDIGGMAEKVRDRVDGIHVQSGNSTDWISAILHAKEEEVWSDLRDGVRPPINYGQCADAHIQLFSDSKNR